MSDPVERAKAALNDGRRISDAVAIDLCNELIELRRMEAEWKRRAMDWQPIETAPRDGRYLILAIWGYNDPNGDQVVVVGRWSNYRLEWVEYTPEDVNYDGELHPPTHWMPLPEPPKGDGDA